MRARAVDSSFSNAGAKNARCRARSASAAAASAALSGGGPGSPSASPAPASAMLAVLPLLAMLPLRLGRGSAWRSHFESLYLLQSGRGERPGGVQRGRQKQRTFPRLPVPAGRVLAGPQLVQERLRKACRVGCRPPPSPKGERHRVDLGVGVGHDLEHRLDGRLHLGRGGQDERQVGLADLWKVGVGEAGGG
jgi:hypothetical protein